MFEGLSAAYTVSVVMMVVCGLVFVLIEKLVDGLGHRGL